MYRKTLTRVTAAILLAFTGMAQAEPPDHAGADQARFDRPDRGEGERTMRFRTRLEGFDAAGNAVSTDAQGRARVEVIDNGTALRFDVRVAKIRNLFMAHIHIAPNPVTLTEPAGPVAYWFTGGPPPASVVRERVNGELANGFIITDGDLEVWNGSSSKAGTVEGLIEAIQQGRASVIVHTNDLNPDTPTGVAGDSPAGELRGTLRAQ